MRSFIVACATLLAVAFAVSINGSLMSMSDVSGRQGVLPKAWPARHTHVEYEYDVSSAAPQSTHRKKFFYDYPRLSLRVDSASAAPSALAGLYGFTSYWLNDTLYMSVNVPSVPALSTCTSLSMGFGMMRPDWMLANNGENITRYDDTWITRRFDAYDLQYYRVVSTAKASPVSPFHYFSANATGAPFSMFAPSPAGTVVNEYTDFAPLAGNASFPAGTFTLPAKCKGNGTSVIALPLLASARRHTTRHHRAVAVGRAIEEAIEAASASSSSSPRGVVAAEHASALADAIKRHQFNTVWQFLTMSGIF